jgi:patatin-like phospholipase/acyl hydrolase
VDLDGGGIRGLSELIILDELMERIRWIKKLPRVPIPADYFDLIGGTSTGGYAISFPTSVP